MYKLIVVVCLIIFFTLPGCVEDSNQSSAPTQTENGTSNAEVVPVDALNTISRDITLLHDLAAEQALIGLIRRQAAQAESLGDRATRYLYEKILLETEERAYHLAHFLAHDSLTLGFMGNGNSN